MAWANFPRKLLPISDDGADLYPHLLGLPPSVRLRIYQHLELHNIRFREINLSSDKEIAFSYFREACRLALTCRALYSEISSILYGVHRVSIDYDESHGLWPLRNLTPSSTSRLSDLSVLLNVSFCTYCRHLRGHQNCPNLEPYTRVTPPVQISTPRGQRIVSCWEETVKLLAKYVKPSRLRLYFACDVDDIETAEAVVKPLLSLPPLASCWIRLGRQPNRPLSRLAATVAKQVTGQLLEPREPFHFLQLPVELQLRILEYTDLIAPFGEVEWSPKGYRIYHHCRECNGISTDCAEHYACQFLTCRDERSPGRYYCMRRFASFATNCECWVPPTSFFLVSRSMREVASRVFFSKNRFIVHDVEKKEQQHQSGGGRQERLAASIFLSDIVPSLALHYLHVLEIVLPSGCLSNFTSDSTARQDWLKTVNYLDGKIDPVKLILRIYMRPNASDPKDVPANITEQHLTKLKEPYFLFAAPFSVLRLEQVFVYATYPLPWNHDILIFREGNRKFQFMTTYMDASFSLALQTAIREGQEYDKSYLAKAKGTRRSQWLASLKHTTTYSYDQHSRLVRPDAALLATSRLFAPSATLRGYIGGEAVTASDVRFFIDAFRGLRIDVE